MKIPAARRNTCPQASWVCWNTELWAHLIHNGLMFKLHISIGHGTHHHRGNKSSKISYCHWKAHQSPSIVRGNISAVDLWGKRWYLYHQILSMTCNIYSHHEYYEGLCTLTLYPIYPPAYNPTEMQRAITAWVVLHPTKESQTRPEAQPKYPKEFINFLTVPILHMPELIMCSATKLSGMVMATNVI